MTTPSGGGTEIGVVIGVDATQAGSAIPVLDNLGTATVKVIKSIDELSNATEKNAKWIANANQTYKNKIQLLEEQWKAEQKAINSEKEYSAAVEKTVAENTRFVTTLKEMVATFGMSKHELMEMTAAQLNATAAAAPHIAQLKALTAEYGAYGVVIKTVEQLEKERIEFETSALTVFNAFKRRTLNENAQAEESAIIALNAQRARALAEQQAMEESAAISLAAFKKRTMAVNRAEAIAEIDRMEAARISAQEREMSAAIAFAAFKKRTLNENAAEEIRTIKEKEQAAVVLAEKQAIEEIKWNAMSVKSRIVELEKLKAYQANSAIRPETVNSMFSSAALQDLAKLPQLHEEYAKAMAKSHSGSNALKGATEELGISFSNNRARTELLVLAHEALQGRFTRMPGSLMVLGEYTNAASLAFTGMGAAMLGVVGTLGFLAYATYKGVTSQREMTNAVIMTGYYAQSTGDRLNDMAHAAVESGGSIGEAKKAVTALAASGKFTGDQLMYITDSVVAMEHATGQSIDLTIKQFESLAVQAQGHSTNMTQAVGKAVLKLDDQYHFLNTSIYEQIVALEKEGRAKEASAIATKTFADVTKQRAEEAVENVGNIVAIWKAVTHAIGGAVDAAGNWGKRQTPKIAVDKISNELAEFDANSAATSGNGAGADQLARIADHRSAIVNRLITAVTALNKVDAEANKIGAENKRNSDANHAIQENEAMMLRLKRKEQGELNTALFAYRDNLKIIAEQDPNSDRLDPARIKREEELITKFHSQKSSSYKGEDKDGRIAAQLADADAEYNLIKQATEDNEKLIKKSVKARVLDEDAGYALMKIGREEELQALEVWYKARTTILDKYKLKKDAKYQADTENKFKDQKQDIANATGENEADRILKSKEAYESLAKAIDNANKTELDRLDKAIAKQREHNEEIGKTKEQVELARAARDEALAASNEVEAVAIQAVLDGTAGVVLQKETERDFYTKRLEFLNQSIAKYRELKALETKGAALEKASPEQYGKDADKAAKQWQSAGNTIAKSLTDAFGKGGKAAAGMFKAFAEGQAKQLELNKQLVLERAAAAKTDNEAGLITQANDKYNAESARNRMGEYGDMASAASGFFDTQSKGYKTLQAISQVFHAAELAMTIAELVPKATAAILNQANGDPYTAFARMATMAAIVAGLGVATGSFGSKGAGGKSAAEVQKEQGTGSVFGNSTAKSDSINRSIELMGKNSVMELTYSSLMLQSLRNIESSMRGVTNLVARADGVTNGTNLGIRTGTLSDTRSNIGVLTGVGAAAGAGVGLAAGAAYGAMTGAALGPIGMIIGGLVGGAIGLISSLWGKTKQNIVDSGIQFSGSVNDLQAGKGYKQYASVDTTKSSWFGLKKSTSNSIQTQGLNDELSKQFGLMFTNLEDSLKVAAVGMGIGADSVGKALDNLVLKTNSVSLKDLKGDDLTAALNGVISKAMDEMAEAAFPQFDQFRQVGEGYAETVMRVANDTITVKDIYSVLGKTMTMTGLNAASFSEDLIKVAGGLDALTTNTKFFVDNFMSESEKLAPTTKALAKELEALGMGQLTSADAFKKAVIGSLDGTEAGNKLYASLIRLAPAFDMVAKAESARYDKQLDLQLQIANLEKNSAHIREFTNKQRALELDKLDESLKPLQMRVWALEDEASALADVQTAKDKLNDAYGREKDVLDNTIQTMGDWANSLTSFAKGLLLGSESTLTPEQKYAEATSQYNKTLALAEGGDKNAQNDLQSAATAFLNASQVVNSNDAKYVDDFNKIQKDMQDASKWAQTQVDIAQASLNALEKQVLGLIDVKNEVITVSQAVKELLAAMTVGTTSTSSTTGGVLTPTPDSQYNVPNLVIAPLVAELQAVRAELAAIKDQAATGTTQVVQTTLAGALLVSKTTDEAITAAAQTGNYNYRLNLDTQIV